MEIYAIDHFHGKEPLILLGKKLIEHSQVGMGEIGEGAKLFFK